jgi:hypothetical protein
MKQVTAVEWLEEEIRYYISNDDRLFYMFKKAKEMEKQQIKDAYMGGTAQFANDARIDYPKTAEQYYNETFKNK